MNKKRMFCFFVMALCIIPLFGQNTKQERIDLLMKVSALSGMYDTGSPDGLYEIGANVEVFAAEIDIDATLKVIIDGCNGQPFPFVWKLLFDEGKLNNYSIGEAMCYTISFICYLCNESKTPLYSDIILRAMLEDERIKPMAELIRKTEATQDN